MSIDNLAHQHGTEHLEPGKPAGRDNLWRYLVLAVAGGLLLALLLIPGAPLEQKLVAVLQGMCAQQHNVFLMGIQLPICARCVGIYSSFLVSILLLWGLGRKRAGGFPHWSISALLLAFVLFMAVDGLNSFFRDLGLAGLYTPRNDLRTLTGMGMGIAIAVGVLLIFNLSLRKDVDARQPVLKNWQELAGLLLVNFLLLAATFGNIGFMYWPLALLSFFGMLSVLYISSLLISSIVLGYENAVTSPLQLAKPALVAIIATSVIVGSMAWVRHWLALQGLTF